MRHLFACNAYPTDLSPEDLWPSPVGSIIAYSYLDNGNLDDGPGRGKQKQQQPITLPGSGEVLTSAFTIGLDDDPSTVCNSVSVLVLRIAPHRHLLLYF